MKLARWLSCLVVVGCGTGAIESTLPPPSDLSVTQLGSGLHVTWKDNSANEDEFSIERKTTGSFGVIGSVVFDTVQYHDEPVTPGTVYTYRVRATKGATASAYSGEAKATGPGGTGGGAGGGTGGGSAGAAGGTGGSGGSGGGAGTGGGAGGGTGGGGGSTGTGGGMAVVSFKADVVPALVATCGSNSGGCHAAAQASGRSMTQYGPCKVIWFSPVNAPLGAYSNYPTNTVPTGCPNLSLYERLLQQHSMLCTGATWQDRPVYVVPGDLTKSLLYQVLSGDASFGSRCTSNGTTPVRRMPVIDSTINPGGISITNAEIAKIRDWILQGAQNN